MKPFYRNIVTIGIFLTVMLMIVGTASALKLSNGGILNETNSVTRASGTLNEISSDPVMVGDTSNEGTTPTSNVGTLSSQTITVTEDFNRSVSYNEILNRSV